VRDLASSNLRVLYPLEDKDYQVPFAFTGTIDKLTVQLN